MIGCSISNNSVMAVFTSFSSFGSSGHFKLKATMVPPDFRRRSSRARSVDDFKESRGSHTPTDTHGDNGVFGLAPATFDQSMASETRTGHAIGMPYCNRTAVDIELLGIDTELVAAVDYLNGERFVE